MKLDRYWPAFLQEIEDFRQLALAEQPEIDSIWGLVKQAPQDFFLDTLTLAGVRRWETILGIQGAGGTLEERRQQIRMKYADQLPPTFRYLQEWLRSIDPNIVAGVLFTLYVLKITVPQGFGMAGELARQLREMVPVNMEIEIGTNNPMDVHAGAALGFTYRYLRIGGS